MSNYRSKLNNNIGHNSSNAGSKGSNFKAQEVSFLLVGDERCGISIPYVLLVDQVKKIIKVNKNIGSYMMAFGVLKIKCGKYLWLSTHLA
jgi:hypothetical protein